MEKTNLRTATSRKRTRKGDGETPNEETKTGPKKKAKRGKSTKGETPDVDIDQQLCDAV